MAIRDVKMNNKTKLCVEELKAIKVLGKGGCRKCAFGCKRWLQGPSICSQAHNKNCRDQEWSRKSRGIARERDILSSLHHPFLPFLIDEVETATMVGWAVEYCPGGDLHYLRQIQPDKSFSESAIRFYAGEVVLAVEHLHSQGIVYRDLKPENILLQSSGHIMLTDFDLSIRLLPHSNKSHPCHEQQHSSEQRGGWAVLVKMLTSKPKKSCPSTQVSPNPSIAYLRSKSFVGTDEYVAPEIVNGEGHEFSVDWWSLGILLYEMLYGKTPFKGSNKKETFARILFMRPKLMGPSTPLHDLILKLLEKNPQKRLGFFKGADEVKRHLFFTGLRWDSLHQVCRPPVVPHVDTSYNYCTDHLLSSDLENFIHAVNTVSESEAEETSDSEIDGLF